MPDMDGFTFASWLRASRATSGIAAPLYIIATSAGTNPETAAKALAAGANELLTKPYSIQTLQTQLQAVLGDAMPSAQARLRSAQLAQRAQRIQLGKHDEGMLHAEAAGPDRSDPALRAAFVASCRQDFVALEAAAHAGDATEVRRQAHRLRGAALLMGAMGIAEGAAELETAEPSVALQRALPTLARMRTMLQSS